MKTLYKICKEAYRVNAQNVELIKPEKTNFKGGSHFPIHSDSVYIFNMKDKIELYVGRHVDDKKVYSNVLKLCLNINKPISIEVEVLDKLYFWDKLVTFLGSAD